MELTEKSCGGDSLNPADYRGGWRTNEALNILGVPCVRKMDKMESTSYLSGLAMMAERKVSATKDVVPADDTEKKKAVEPIQLSLFE